MVLPIHATRPARLGRHRAARSGERHVSWTRAQAAAASKSQRLLLRPGPDHRRIPAREAVRPQADLGERHRGRRPAPRGGGNKPTPAGTKTCPAVRGATNWYATAFNPETKLFY